MRIDVAVIPLVRPALRLARIHQVAQLLARLEERNTLGRDCNCSSGLRISSRALPLLAMVQAHPSCMPLAKLYKLRSYSFTPLHGTLLFAVEGEAPSTDELEEVAFACVEAREAPSTETVLPVLFAG